MISPKNRYKAVIILLVLFLFIRTGFSQYYRTGSEAAGISWKSIETDHIQVIFPSAQSELAQEFTSKFEYALDYFKPNLKKKPKKLSIVLHNYHSRSNGVMSWAPRRMELWTRPPQSLAAQDWLELLIVHEYRHYIQISNLDQGFTTALKWLFGQQGQLIPLGLHIPMWYLEGDAVVAETMHSRAGRGRDPAFSQEFKAMVLEEGIPTYDKVFLGSYVDYMPNHYQTGYDIVAAHLLYNSSTVFDEKLDNIAKHPIYLNPFRTKARGLRDRGKTKFYEDAILLLDSIWRSDNRWEDHEQEDFVLMEPAQYLNLKELKKDGNVLYAFAESFGDLPSLVSVEDSMLKLECRLGYLADQEIDVVGNQLVWVETETNPLWDQHSFSNVWLMNLQTKQKRKVTEDLFLASPALNAETKTIAAVEYHPDYRFNLILINSDNGDVLKRLPNPGNDILFHPAWSDDGRSLVYVALGKEGKALKIWTIEEGSRMILDAGFNELSNPILVNNVIYFTGGFDGVNQIYAYAMNTGELKQLTNAPFGANYCSVNEKKNELLYTSFHSRGNRIVKQTLSKGRQVRIEKLHPPTDRFAEKLSIEIGEVIDFEKTPKRNYQEKKYSKLGHALNLHSWYPVSVDLDDNMFYPGITLMSQDVLSNSELTLNYNANPGMKNEMFSAGMTYYGVWPNIHLNSSFGFDNDQISFEGSPIDLQNTYNSGDLSLTFPLNFSRHTWYRGLWPEISLGYGQKKIDYQLYGSDHSFTNRYVPFTLWLSGYGLKQMAKRDLEFPWGVSFRLGYSTSLGKNSDDTPSLQYVNQGSVFGYGLSGYLKGLAPHHSLIINHAFQNKTIGEEYVDDETGMTVFQTMSNLVSLPRGVFDVNRENIRMLRLALDYQFPIAYPDLRLGWLAYMKRIGGGLFVDYGDLTNIYSRNEKSLSVGGSLYFDCNFLRYEPDVRLGLQMGYNLSFEDVFSNLIFSVNMPW